MPSRLKRFYDKPEVGDGCRILVARLWSRGASKQEATISLWLKDIAPSTGLRKWFGHSTLRRHSANGYISPQAFEAQRVA